MSGYILGEKADQSQQFTQEGLRVPTTTVKSSSCYCITITDSMVRLAFGLGKNVKKPQIGELEKAGIKTPLRFFRELQLKYLKDAVVTEDDKGKKVLQLGELKISVGDQIKPSMIFKEGDMVTVMGVSKGKGFQGVVKRHGFSGGPKTHGQSDRWRAPGSIGSGTTPGRILKGKKMAGRMGNDVVTVKNLQVMSATDDQLVLRGLVPGHKRALIEVYSK